ncbi:F0F1 ATP synthase subunit B family protein [Roseinatronobacter bogoriensis]|uniref:ATP synthase subunit b n=1 Tax=Roseinatronobacter bogoriensis subsp. barguzinensis TaxID=441209 RepID=A0A2K8KI02_9RHOB|nr:ATP F0F1 synthase subunit B [Rhodobaca]ATX65770.1 ATP F0F1 synthase subunit B [Rhodobaca barguzinensis]TDW38915.1 ATP synthase F0 subcomplex B subunit [Rhodobaca barguzinensis]TDY68902.1 ATP synthase F0 subcomplex B subunit [Rhodobaca bogoriensis DSM 18756]
MMLRLSALAMIAASPAWAAPAGKPFFSLYNTDLIVLMAFIIFIGILVYFKVPEKVSGLLDSRAVGIQSELDEARRLREEALALHASFERRHAEVKDDAARIVEKAKADAQLAAKQAKDEIEASIARRLKGAEEQIASAEAAAIRDVRNKAVAIAIAAAGDMMAKQMDADGNDALVQKAIASAQEHLH